MERLAIVRPKPTQRHRYLCLDEGHDYAEPRRLAMDLGFRLHLRIRGEEVQTRRHANGEARRWVVEVAQS